eukprot:5590783-Amphidinium_carterae.1
MAQEYKGLSTRSAQAEFKRKWLEATEWGLGGQNARNKSNSKKRERTSKKGKWLTEHCIAQLEGPSAAKCMVELFSRRYCQMRRQELYWHSVQIDKDIAQNIWTLAEKKQ